MNSEHLIIHFERLADTPDAIPRLRRFILDLAVRGKLVKQNPKDEPASELLKQIAASQARLLNTGKAKKGQTFKRPAPVVPFGLPQSWEWAPLGKIFLYDAGIKRAPKELDPSSWLLELEDIEKESGRLVARVHAKHRKSKSTKSEFQEGDILYGKLRPYLNKVLVADSAGYSTTEIVAIRPIAALNPEYCALALRRPDFVEYVTRLGQGTKMPRLRKNDALNAPFPLAPLAEQDRIVAKVDEMMTLCDRLQEARMARKLARTQLAKTTLARLSEPNANTATFRSHARFAIESLPALTTRADQLKHLRQTILNLAVRGKLVAQRPDREKPASLPRSNLQGEGGDFSRPVNWCSRNLGEILDFRYGKGLTANQRKRDGPVPVYGSNGIVGYTTEPLTKQSCVIVGRKGSAGALNICNGPSWTTDVAYYIEVPDFLSLRFLYISLSALNLDYLAKGVKPGLSRSDAYSKRMSIPPLSEQHRIAAKVDRLMALCDGIEAGLININSSRASFLESALLATL